jgi:cobalamin synthase
LSNSGKRGLLSIGVFLLIMVASILLYQPLQLFTDWLLIVPLIVALAGCWLMVLAGLRAARPQQYERGAFSTLSWGVLFVAVGGAWFLYGYGWFYSLAMVLIALAFIAIAAALKLK